jgi:hypothetical protein
VDKADFSVARSYQLFRGLFDKADLKIIKDEVQHNWPQELLGVRMYLLQ